MSGFRREGAVLCIDLSEMERRLLTDLAQQFIGVLDAASGRTGTDPAIRRLLPDAYPGDEDASTEFRRFTADRLVEKKTTNALAVIASFARAIDDTPDVRLDADDAQAWLRTLTGIRITLAARLGIEHDGDDGRRDDDAMPMQQVYAWLGYLQESLIEAL